MAQLGLGLGLTKGGVTPFNPLSLDPYLFFDAQTSMIGTLENPTLDLDPATPSTLDVITATRAGVATYTDASGVIQSAAANTVRVDQTQGAELTPTKYQNIGYTDFSSGWSGIRTETEQGANHLGFPSRLITRTHESSTSSGTYYFVPSSLTDGQTYRYSLYIRRITGTSDINLRHRYAVEGSDSLVSVTEDWQRFEVSATKAVGSNIQFGVKIADFGDQIEISQPQVEEGTTASDFVANTTGSPKFITGATYGPRVPMILVEPSATNLFEYSEDFTQWSLSKEGTGEFPVVTSDYADGPLGGLADRIQFSTGGGTSGSDGADVRLSPTVANGTAYTYSVWLKSLSGSVDVKLLAQSCSPNSYTATVTPEWQKFTYPLTGGFNGLRIVRVAIKGNDTTTADVLVWGAQLETGTVATSYIPTSGSTVTRAADDLVIDGSDFSNFFNSGGDGTFFVTAQIKNPAENHSLLRGGSNFQLYVYSNDGSGQHYTYDGGTASSYGGVVENQLTNFAISYGASTYTISRDGTNPSPQAGSGNLSSATKLEIGKGYSNLLNGHIKRVIYWPLHSDNL